MRDAVYLLIETAEGATVAVRFSDPEEAQRWEDEHYGDVEARGLVRVVNRTEALMLSR